MGTIENFNPKYLDPDKRKQEIEATKKQAMKQVAFTASFAIAQKQFHSDNRVIIEEIRKRLEVFFNKLSSGIKLNKEENEAKLLFFGALPRLEGRTSLEIAQDLEPAVIAMYKEYLSKLEEYRVAA